MAEPAGAAPEAPVATGPRRLLLVRHGQTSWNAVGRAQGHGEISLDEEGRAQAAAAAPYLASLRPVALWSSDLARARETCAYVEDATDLTAVYDERLREFDVGEREGLTMAEFADRFPEAFDARLDGDWAAAVPGAERAEEVEDRIVPALWKCLSSLSAGETGLVVTHGAAMRVAVTALLGWPPQTARDLRGVDNCAWVTLEQLEQLEQLGERTGRVEHGGRGSGPDGWLRLVGYNESVRPGHDAPRKL